MYREVAKLIIYGNHEDTILMKMSDIFKKFDRDEETPDKLISDIYEQIKRILEVATDYGFDKNLWHNYLTFYLITNENPFSLTCEKVGANDGSVNEFAKNDFKVFMNLFNYDFRPIEAALGINCFSLISDYKAIVKKELMYNKNVSEKVQALSLKLETAKDENEFFNYVTDFYKAYGAVNYDAVSGKGFETYFNKKEEITLLKAYFKLKKEVDKNYDSVKEMFFHEKETLNGIEFWKRYLSLE